MNTALWQMGRKIMGICMCIVFVAMSGLVSSSGAREPVVPRGQQTDTPVVVLPRVRTPDTSVRVPETIPSPSPTPNLQHNAYRSLNPFYLVGYGGQCTAFAWGRALEKVGIALPFRRDARTWWTVNKAEGHFAYGSEPRANSIAVWDNRVFGHVAFVEAVRDGVVLFNEGNWTTCNDTRFGGGYDGAVKTLTVEQMRQRNQYRLLGYIYLVDEPQPISQPIPQPGPITRSGESAERITQEMSVDDEVEEVEEVEVPEESEFAEAALVDEEMGLAALPSPAEPAGTSSTKEDDHQPRLSQWMTALVVNTSGHGLLVWEEPNSKRMGNNPEGTLVQIIDGPVFAAGHWRWKIISPESPNGGWSAETYLQPVEPLSVGRSAIVANAESGLRLREDPGGVQIGGNCNDTVVTIVDGPLIADGQLWWKVESPAGTGWSAGAWLLPTL